MSARNLMFEKTRPGSLGLAFLSVFFFLLSSMTQEARAQIQCDRIHAPAKPYSLEWRVDSRSKDIVMDEDGNVDYLASGGALLIKEQPLSGQSKTALMELIRMVSATRAVKFSFKEFEGKEFGKLVLGVPLANKYSVEILYKSDFREGHEPSYGAEEMRLITPSGKPEIIRKNLQNIEGGLADDLIADLSDYPSISQLEFKLHIPAEITGEALATFSQIAPKIELLSKTELRDIAKTNNYMKLKALIHFRAFKAKTNEYLTKGYFKTIYKWTVAPLLAFGLVMGANTVAPEKVAAVRNVIKTTVMGSQDRWLSSTLDMALESRRTPENIKAQIRALKADFQKSLKEQAANPLSKKGPIDLAQPQKFQISKDQYMWIQKTVDPENRREHTLVFITQDNKYGQIEYAVTEIDAQKYKSLIDYIQGKGQMLPLRLDGVTQ